MFYADSALERGFANEIFSSTPIKHLTVLTILTATLRILLSTGASTYDSPHGKGGGGAASPTN